MNSWLSFTVNSLFNLLASARSLCSLRRLAPLLPIWVPAPRLNIQIPRNDPKCHHSLSDDSCPTDNTYTTTTSLTDFNQNDTADREPSFAHVSIPNASKRSKLQYKRCYSVPDSSDPDSRIRLHHSDDSPRLPRRYCKIKPNVGSRKVPQASHARPKTLRRTGCKGYYLSRTRSRAKSSLRSISTSSSETSDAYSSHISRLPRNRRSTDVYETKPNSLCAAAAPVGSERITYLETELARLRAQLAQLIVLQEGKQLLTTPLGEYDQRLDGDGESDAGPVGTREAQLGNPLVPIDSEKSEITSPPTRRPPLPPPPPTSSIPPPPSTIPPPPPLSSNTVSKPSVDWRAQLIANRNKKRGVDGSQNQATAQTPPAASMSQVLKELQSGSVKLRTVPRSPGGTPLRAQRSPTIHGTDPCSIIARAIQNKFCKLRSAMDLSTSGGENTPNSSMQESAMEHTELRPHSRTPDNVVSKEKSDAEFTPFGQHLLRPVPADLSHDTSIRP